MSDLAQLTTVPSTKRSLLVLSHAMERAFDTTPPDAGEDPHGVIIGLFQRREYFDVEAARYAQLAAAGHTVIVGFAGPAEGLPPYVHGVSFPEHDPRAAEWILVLARGPYATALVACDHHELATGEMTLSASRLFGAWWTFRRRVALDEGRRQLERMAGDLDPEVFSTAVRRLQGSSALPVSSVETRLATAADHLVTSLEAGQQRLSRLRSQLEDVHSIAERDQLTGLNNRHYLERYLGGGDRPADLVTMLVDVDNLKSVNDTHGHRAGDAVLSAVADTLRRYSRSGDVTVRWGGDEFLMLVPGLDPAMGLAFAQRIAIAIRASHPEPPWAHLPLSVSIGVCPTKRTILPLDRLDAALYSVKRSGKGHASLAEDCERSEPQPD
jgi:diguanylate cyclase (GGDEF)-like protein